MKKRILAMMLVVSMVVACFIGCGNKSAGKTESQVSNIDWNETGYPIVNEPITLKVGVSSGSVSQGDWNDLVWVKELEKASGINLEFVTYSNSEAVNLMFASQTYPDISIGIGSDKQISEAAAGGAVVALDEYLEKYAPNWYTYLNEHEDVKRNISLEDGHIYSLPMIRDEYYNYSFRDQWLIEKAWLDKLGLQIPTTVNEFYNVLKAIKASAGKNGIPEDVVPYYIQGVTANVGGAMDFINSFGIRVVSNGYLVTVDDNGKVEFNWTDKDIIEPINWLNKFVNEGLIPKACFTDSNDTYLTKIKSTTRTLACYHAYSNRDLTMTETVAMAPLNAENGSTPIVRSQNNVITRNQFTVYSNCAYPEIAVRLANMIAEEEWSIQATYGMIEEGENAFVTKSEDGKYNVTDGDGEYAGLYVPGERVSYLITEERYQKINLTETSKNYSRNWAAENIYKDYAMDQKNLYPVFAFSEENIDRITDLRTDINNYITQTFDKWAMNGGAEKGWDAYVKQLKAYGLDEYLQLLQEELDAYNAR